MNILAGLTAILLLCGLLGAIGCGFELLCKAKCWTAINKRHVLTDYPARWKVAA